MFKQERAVHTPFLLNHEKQPHTKSADTERIYMQVPGQSFIKQRHGRRKALRKYRKTFCISSLPSAACVQNYTHIETSRDLWQVNVTMCFLLSNSQQQISQGACVAVYM